MKVFQNHGLSIYTISSAYSAIFNPPEDAENYNFYIGLLRNDVSIITTQSDEPTAKSYKRAKTNGDDWIIELKQIDKCLVISATNKKQITFNEVSDDWGEVKAVCVFRDNTALQFSAYSQLPKGIEIAISNPPNTPVFKKNKLVFAMPLLEEDSDDENVISTILNGEKSIMLGKKDEYTGCPLDNPNACSEYKSKLRCALKREDKVCKKVAKLKGTVVPGMMANAGQRRRQIKK